jgi:hypothetical protein
MIEVYLTEVYFDGLEAWDTRAQVGWISGEDANGRPVCLHLSLHSAEELQVGTF